VTDLNGNVITDGSGNPGFPGFDAMNVATSLAYVVDMQTHNVPVTYAYISDLHDNHSNPANPQIGMGPGEQDYENQLHAADAAFGKFFQNLAAQGINKSNAVITVTSDENDHYAGGPPHQPGCTGAAGNYCTYAGVNVKDPKFALGELDGSISGMLNTQIPGYTAPPGDDHTDSAPNVYLKSDPGVLDNGVEVASAQTRIQERDLARLQETNPRTGLKDTIANYIAGPTEMNLLHMITGDPARNPTYTLFANPTTGCAMARSAAARRTAP
jgi:hypothetical protein